MDLLIRRLMRAAVQRAWLGDHWAWLLIALTTYLLRRARRSGAGSLVTSVPIHAGERLQITVRQPGTPVASADA